MLRVSVEGLRVEYVCAGVACHRTMWRTPGRLGRVVRPSRVWVGGGVDVSFLRLRVGQYTAVFSLIVCV